jgi:hypothetical protein
MLKERLTEAFPGVDFYARTIIRWVDGPTVAEVQVALGDMVNGEGDFQRTLSADFKQLLAKEVESVTGVPFNEHSYYDEMTFKYGKTRPGYGNQVLGQLAEEVKA